MKSTESFKKIIESKLNQMAESDKLFALNLKKENKNIDDCITYILNSVRNSGCNGFSEDEIYGMAAHYYDEDNIKVGKSISCNVVVNQKIELSEEEKDKAKKEAYDLVISQERDRLMKKSAPKTSILVQVEQPTLF